MEGVLFMHRTEARGQSAATITVSLLLGSLLALGIELVILLIGAIAVSKGIFRSDASSQITAAACLVGCLAGGCFTGRSWQSKRLLAGIASGAICYILILMLALLTGGGVENGAQALMEMICCLVGGGLAGVLSGRKKKRKAVGKSRKK